MPFDRPDLLSQAGYDEADTIPLHTINYTAGNTFTTSSTQFSLLGGAAEAVFIDFDQPPPATQLQLAATVQHKVSAATATGSVRAEVGGTTTTAASTSSSDFTTVTTGPDDLAQAGIEDIKLQGKISDGTETYTVRRVTATIAAVL
jgi:hypothetical protein